MFNLFLLGWLFHFASLFLIVHNFPRSFWYGAVIFKITSLHGSVPQFLKNWFEVCNKKNQIFTLFEWSL